MANGKSASESVKLTDQATLGLLSALETQERVTQRSLAARIGVALGLTNSLLKRCIHKGLVKVTQAPAKRYSYYVTPKGFTEKSRLVADYLSASLSFFRQAKDEYGTLFGTLKARGIESVVLCGTGELAEIAVLAAQEQDLDIHYVLQAGSNQELFCGYQVRNNLDDLKLGKTDAVIITSIDAPQKVYDRLCEVIPAKDLYAPRLLHLYRSVQSGAE